MRIENILKNGFLYNIFQNLTGWKNVSDGGEFLTLPKTEGRRCRVLDIGCGPGTQVWRFMDAEYYGFDLNEQNIRMAQRKYKSYPNLRFFHADVSAYFNTGNFTESDCFDLEFMLGVLHHLSDDEIASCVSSVKKLLRPANKNVPDCGNGGGELRTVDVVDLPQKSAFTGFLLRHDRGKFVRTEEGYVSLLKPHFSNIETRVFTNIIRLPIPLIFIKCTEPTGRC
jgi:SAM-dependent methyltransferase